jgi:hypothetical protein
MSRAEARTALAAAASTVEGITCSPYFVQTTKAGAAMVRFDSTTYPNPFGGVVTWQVVVTLPQDYATSEKFIDDHVLALVGALAREMTVARVYQVQLTLKTGSLPVLICEGTREED